MKRAFIKHIFAKLLPVVMIMCAAVCVFYMCLHNSNQKEYFYTKISNVYNLIYTMDNITNEVKMINENEAVSKASKVAGIFEYGAGMSYGDLKRETEELGICDIYVFDKTGTSLFENSETSDYLAQSEIYKNALFNIPSVSGPEIDYKGEKVIYAAARLAGGDGAVIVSIPYSELVYFQKDKSYHDVLSFIGINENEAIFIADAETKDIIASVGGVGKMSTDETVKHIIKNITDDYGLNSDGSVINVGNVKLFFQSARFDDIIIGYASPWSSFAGESGVLLITSILALIIVTSLMLFMFYYWIDKNILVKLKEIINEIDSLASGKALNAHIRINYDIDELVSLCGNINTLIDALNGVHSEKYESFEENKLAIEEQDMFFAERQIITDIADKAVNEEQIENKIKNEFFKGLVYRLNLHMDIVLGLCELALLKFSNDNTYSYINDIKLAAFDITLLLNNITDIFEIHLGRPEIESEEYFTDKLIRDIINESSFAAHRKGIEIRTDIDANIPEVLIGDEFKVHKIISNILRAFIISSENCSILFSAQCESLENKQVKLIFSVSCSGTEIRPELFKDIIKSYNFFKQEKQKETNGDTEIKIASKLASMLGGDIEIADCHKNGSAFNVYVIQKKADYYDKEPELSQNMNLFKAPDIKALIIDGNKAYAGIISEYLKVFDICADICADVNKVKNFIDNTKYDIVFISSYSVIYQPDNENCINVLKQIREFNQHYKDVPVISVISDKTAKARKELILSGTTDIILRPVTLSDFVNTVQKYLPDDSIKNVDPEVNMTDEYLIEGINIEKGLAECGQSMDIYIDLLKIFCESLEKNLQNLEQSKKENDFKNYGKYIGDIRVNAADIGAERLELSAALLERASEENNGVFISENTSGFISYSKRIIAVVKKYLKKSQ